MLVDDVRRVTRARLLPMLRGRRVDVLAASPPCQGFSPLSMKKVVERKGAGMGVKGERGSGSPQSNGRDC